MKKIFSVILCAALVLSVLLTATACKPDGGKADEIVVYNWADYIYDYEDDFKAYYKELTGRNIEVTYVTFDTNETMLTKIIQGDAKVDVICPSEYAIQKLIESDRLVKLNYFDEQSYVSDGLDKYSGYVHNGENVDKNILDKVSQGFGNITVNGESKSMLDYFVPYMYGTLGILYNKYAFMELDIYDAETMNKANWGMLFNDNGEGGALSDKLDGNILMKDSIRDSYAATVFYLLESGKLNGKTYSDANSEYNGTLYTEMPIGALINAVDEYLLEQCRTTLTDQKKQLFGYEVDFGKDDLLKGNAMIDLAWSGDAMYAVEESWDDALCSACSEERHTRVYGEEKRDENNRKYYVCPYCQEECGDYELSYYVPHTSGNIWFDGWVIPKTYDPTHLDAIKIFINFLNSPRVAAENMMEIGYSAAVSPDVIRSDAEARSVLSAAYTVYDPEYWDMIDTDGEKVGKGQKLTLEDCDYEDWDAFCEYFFDGLDAIDNSNWRYPFVIAEQSGGAYNRSIDTLGVMRDFGVNNKAVVTMWNAARSTGDNALPLLGWTALAVALAVGIAALCEYFKFLRKTRVKVSAPPTR